MISGGVICSTFSRLCSCCNISIPSEISVINRIIPTICVHIVAQHTLAGGCVAVRADESTHVGIVISALQIIQSGFVIVRLAIGAKWGRIHGATGDAKTARWFI